MGWKRVQGFIVTSDPVKAYGGVQLSEEVLRDLVERLARGEIPMTGNHDSLQHIRTRNLQPELRRTSEGGLGVWIDVEVDEEDWERSGLNFGWSVALTAPLERDE